MVLYQQASIEKLVVRAIIETLARSDSAVEGRPYQLYLGLQAQETALPNIARGQRGKFLMNVYKGIAPELEKRGIYMTYRPIGEVGKYGSTFFTFRKGEQQ